MTDDATTPDLPKLDFDPVPQLATELGLPPKGVAAVVALLDEGNTVPFIARYRKERTGDLDEVQIRAIEEQRTYIIELEQRRAAILASVTEQGKLTPELEAKLRAATGKSELEDLYAPYRPRRKTRASVARDRGLEPLAENILAQGSQGDPASEAARFVGEQVATADDALAGARDIVAELIADTAEVRAFVRREFAEHGELVSEVVPGKGDEPTKFEQYYHFKEAVKAIPSHRFLAIRRGEAEGVLRARVAVDGTKVEAGILRLAKLDDASPWAAQLRLAVADALKRLLSPSVENDVRAELKQRSDIAAVDVFAGNLRNLMLAAPIGPQAVVGVDPGLRTGCKCAAIDTTGKFLGTVTIYISQGDAQLAKAKDDFLAFVREHKPRAIAVGNGTGGREAEAFVKRTLADAGLRRGLPGEGGEAAADAPFVVQVNEAGASVYSASDIAREEFPELDLTIRGAISIARRLQDPLAELVKIEPKSIGVGQYQHDVHQPLLGKKLGDVVESCVNHVGVELNTASAMLLGYVAGIGKALAKKLVLHRDTNGAFASRAQLMEVSGLGPKAFEQAAGFLRINSAPNPLDRSAVHPERYPLVEKMAADLGVPLPELIGNQELVDKIDLSKYVVEGEVGEPTLRDIAAELAKPGRDPREEFSPPKFRDDVTTMEDLKQGMVLEGIVTNVTAFGAFVDIGVHNDGLVHVSQLSDQFVKDPSEVVKVGQKLTVRVIEVDTQRKRIALSAKKPQQPQPRGERRDDRGPRGGRGRGGGGPQGDQPQGEPRQMRQWRGGPQAGGDQHRGNQGALEVQGNPGGGDQLQGNPGGGDQLQGNPGSGDQPSGHQGGNQHRGNQGGEQFRGNPGGHQNRGNQGRGNRGGNQNRGNFQGGDQNRGNFQAGDQDRGNFQAGDQNRGNFQAGDQNRGNFQAGDQNRGNFQAGDRNRGNFQGGDNRGQGGDQNRGNFQGGDNRGQGDQNRNFQGGDQNRGNFQGGDNRGQGDQNRGSVQGGDQDRGNFQGGDQDRGNFQGGDQDRGNFQGGDNRGQGDQNRGNFQGGNQNRGQGGDQNRGNFQGGDQNRGQGGDQNRGNFQGDQNRGYQGRGDQRGPRPDNRGSGGPRGPRRDDRGPRDQGPPRTDQPQGDPQARNDGPRRDERAPRREQRRDDRRPEEPPAGYGISGFVNNPFAKLVDKGPKRS